VPEDSQGRRQDLRLLQPAHRREERSEGDIETSLFHEGAAGNLLRNEDDRTVKKADIVAVSKWLKKRALEHEIAFRPARVLMQDSPACRRWSISPRCATRCRRLAATPKKSIRWCRSISSSTLRDRELFGDNKAFGKNVVEEYKQNQERYEF